MDVYAAKRKYDYSGGLMLVAANSAQEAKDVFHNDERYEHMWFVCNDEIQDEYYEEFELVKGLSYDTQFPCVIIEDGYSE